jgi:hypothetical protein
MDRPGPVRKAEMDCSNLKSENDPSEVFATLPGTSELGGREGYGAFAG